ncbi:hypothetical protein ES708_18672 [subsurface metagenome]
MYTIAAIWNWILAVGFLILPRIDIGLFSLAGPMDPPNTLLWFDSFFGLVFAFGLGFYFISKSTTENHGLIKISIFEKFWVFTITLYYFLIPEASLLAVGIVVVDLLFGILFIEDLRAILKTKTQ